MRPRLHQAGDADHGLVLARLHELAAPIDERGGQRRARAYLDGQLRRLR